MVLPHDSFYNHPSFWALPNKWSTNKHTISLSSPVQPASHSWAIWQMACLSVMCGWLLSTPTFLESPIVYYSCLMWTSEPSRRVLRLLPRVHLQLVPNGNSPSEMTMSLMGRLLDFQITTKFRPLEKAKTKYTGPDTCFIYIFIYISCTKLHSEPQGFHNRNKYWNNYIAKRAFCS